MHDGVGALRQRLARARRNQRTRSESQRIALRSDALGAARVIEYDAAGFVPAAIRQPCDACPSPQLPAAKSWRR
jgi:hypothetical protein